MGEYGRITKVRAEFLAERRGMEGVGVSTYDLVIRNGTVVDGSGLGSFRADVGVVGDRIAFVGRIREPRQPRDRRRGPRRHARLRRRPHAHGRAGVLGRVGQQLVLARRHHRGDGQLRVHARAGAARRARRWSCATSSAPRTSIPAALAAGIDWTFETFPEYLDAVDRLPKGINFAANIGHSALRTWAMGERAFTEEATDDDLKLMRGQLADSIRAGAIGFSTSRNEHHETSDDRPVASRLASWDEVAQLVGTMGDLGAGIFETADGGMLAPRRRRARGLADAGTASCAAETQVPMTFGFVADAKRRPAPRLPRRGRRPRAAASSRQTHCRGISVLLSFQHRAAVRPARRRGASSARGPRPSSSGRCATTRERRTRSSTPPSDADYSGWAGVGAQARAARLRGHPRSTSSGLPPNPTVAEIARAAGRRPGGADGRPRDRDRLRAAVHPAEPLPAGRGGAAAARCATRAR